MFIDFNDIVRGKLPELKKDQERATDFIKNALLTGHTDEDISRSFFLNGISKEDTVNYLKKGHEKLDRLLGGA